MIHTKLFPWYMAQARQQTVFWMTLPAQLNAWYWQAWTEAYRP